MIIRQWCRKAEKMRRWPPGLLAICFASAAAAPAPQFPGPDMEIAAPNTGVKVTFSDPGANEYGDHNYALKLVYPDGRSEDIAVFTRTVEVSWSPTGEALAVTNRITNDTSDCYVFTPGPGTAAKISLTEIITQPRYPGPAWALKHSARGSVECDDWLTPDKLRFELNGVGDDNPRGFHYEFVYDLKTGLAKSAAAAAKTPNAKPAKIKKKRR